MVDEMGPSRLIDPGVQGHLRERRTAVDQRATRIIADASEYRGTNARRADHRVRIAPEQVQSLLKLEDCRAREANDLQALVNKVKSAIRNVLTITISRSY